MFLFKAKSNIGGLNMSQAKLGFSLSVPVVSIHALSHAGTRWSTKEVWGGTRDVVECFSPLLENRTQSGLLHLFFNKESVKCDRFSSALCFVL